MFVPFFVTWRYVISPSPFFFFPTLFHPPFLPHSRHAASLLLPLVFIVLGHNAQISPKIFRKRSFLSRDLLFNNFFIFPSFSFSSFFLLFFFIIGTIKQLIFLFLFPFFFTHLSRCRIRNHLLHQSPQHHHPRPSHANIRIEVSSSLVNPRWRLAM